MQRMFTQCGVIVLCLLTFSQIRAQDLHFSQFETSPLNQNPGLTGIFSGDQRFAANYRAQWFSVPVDYMTFTASYDQKFRPDGASSWWNGGAVFNYDRAGDSKLSLAALSVHGSYTMGLSPAVLLTAGACIGGGQRNYNPDDLRWGNFWDGEQVDPGLGSGEPGTLGDSKFIFDLGAGLSLRLQKDARTKVDLGAGFFHLTQPNTSFYDGATAELPIRTSVQLHGSVQLFSHLDLLVNGLMQFQGPYEEMVIGGMLNIHISRKKAREIQLGLGFGYRFDDALIPAISIAYDGWRAGFSYDLNTESLFELATDKKGGPEFSLIYIITEVRPLPDSKVCKIF